MAGIRLVAKVVAVEARWLGAMVGGVVEAGGESRVATGREEWVRRGGAWGRVLDGMAMATRGHILE